MQQWAREQLKTFRSGGQFVPLEVDKQTVVFPGFDGGAEWGGQAFDPQTGLYYVNANDLAWTGGLTPSTGGQSGQALYQTVLCSVPSRRPAGLATRDPVAHWHGRSPESRGSGDSHQAGTRANGGRFRRCRRRR